MKRPIAFCGIIAVAGVITGSAFAFAAKDDPKFVVIGTMALALIFAFAATLTEEQP